MPRAKLAHNAGVDVTKTTHQARSPVRFGNFEADINAVELRRQGAKVKLQEQPFQVLQILLERPGEVVSREELRRQIWPAHTFVDFEQGLNNAIKRLREALGDSPENPQFIETIPRRGYRFVAKLNQPAKCIRSLAVLPLENLSRDPEQEYFAEGLTEALINTLVKIGELQVVSRTSAMQYKGVHRPLREIAQELHVEGIIEGTVLKAGERVRISIQLVDARADIHLWAEHYDRDLRDILALHSEVAQSVAREIQVKLSPVDEARIAKGHPVNPEAYDAYLKGRYYWNRRPAELGRAIQYFEQAMSKDPAYTAAHVGLADCLNSLTGLGIVPVNEGSDKAKRLAQKVFEIDNSSAEACTALAYASLFEYDFATAERGFERAIQLNPQYAFAHQMFGCYLGWMGRYEESCTEVRRAVRLDPLSSTFNAFLAVIYLYARRYDQAIEQCQKALELDPNSASAWGFLGWAQSCKLRHEDAIASLRKCCQIWPGASPIAWLGEAYAAAGYRDEAHKVLRQLEELSKQRYVTSYGRARIYAALGGTDETFKWLETAYQQRDNWMVLLKIDPCFDNFRSDPRFQDLMRRMNFPE
jgi:TolB-like protein/Tfp pilus assembly protein PilF